MIFTIKKYKQSSNNLLFKIFDFINIQKRISYYVNFTNAPKYINKKNIHARTINKLFGLTNGLNESINFGWEYMHREIYVYVYIKHSGKFTSKYLQRILFDKEYKFIIHENKDHCLFTIIDSEFKIKQYKIQNNKTFLFKTYPSLNGSNVALNSINIELISD